MRKPIIIGGNPYILDVYKKDAKTLFEETGGNSGNLAFRYAITSHFRGSVSILPWAASRAEVRAAGDLIVLPLANQLGSHTDLGSSAVRLQEFDLPVLAVGLGAQSETQSDKVQLTAGTALWLNTVAALSPSESPNIGVRGHYTKMQIESFGLQNSSVVIGCPSNFINTSDFSYQLAEKFKKTPRYVAVMAGIPFIPKLLRIERDLAGIVTTTGGSYIVQHGLEMLRLARREFHFLDASMLEICRNYITPHLSIDEFKAWCIRYACAFYDARAWMDYVKRFDFVIGTRFHGAMLAIQAGVPSGCITHDSRTTEMCETMGIPHCHYDSIRGGITQHNMMDLFSFDAEKYRALRVSLLRDYLNLLKNAEVGAARHLEALAQET